MVHAFGFPWTTFFTTEITSILLSHSKAIFPRQPTPLCHIVLYPNEHLDEVPRDTQKHCKMMNMCIASQHGKSTFFPISFLNVHSVLFHNSQGTCECLCTTASVSSLWTCETICHVKALRDRQEHARE